jgi:hypothetical protein
MRALLVLLILMVALLTLAVLRGSQRAPEGAPFHDTIHVVCPDPRVA